MMKLAFGVAGCGAVSAVFMLAIVGSADAGDLRNDPSRLVPPGNAVQPSQTATVEQVSAPAAVASIPAQSAATATPYADLIAHHAQAAGLPVGLVHAVVRVESNYNPKARGPAGSVGLMQIKPQTARGIGYSGDSATLYDPETNLTWGVKYLAGAYRLAGGDLCGTVMRYQGGHRATRMTKANSVYCNKVQKFMAASSQ